MEDPDQRNGGQLKTKRLFPFKLRLLPTDQMLAAWDQLQDADLEDVADVIFAQVHLTIFAFILIPNYFTFILIPNHFHLHCFPYLVFPVQETKVS